MAYFTRSCSGCYETEDGHPVGEYEWDEKAKCYKGSGCKECGYTGKRRTYFSDKVECSGYGWCELHGEHGP